MRLSVLAILALIVSIGWILIRSIEIAPLAKPPMPIEKVVRVVKRCERLELAVKTKTNAKDQIVEIWCGPY